MRLIWIARDYTGRPREAALGGGELCAATAAAWRAAGLTYAQEPPEAWTDRPVPAAAPTLFETA